MPKDFEARLRAGAKGGAPEDMYAQLKERAAKDRLVDIAFTLVDSPLGKLLAAKTKKGLIRLSYEGGANPEASLGHLAETVSPRILEVPARLDDVRRELDEYFEGGRRRFDLPIDWSFAGGFVQKVLRATNRIPYGSVSSYGQIALKAGSPRASRAAGNALGSNPMPIVVPCHRVLRSGGAIGGYTGGLHRKEFLLHLEGVL
jgi:methylated-DNA-[protein]-cysteine S-methyltransferase